MQNAKKTLVKVPSHGKLRGIVPYTVYSWVHPSYGNLKGADVFVYKPKMLAATTAPAVSPLI